MCSILAAFDLRPDADLRMLRPLALAMSARQRHRGPDWSGVHAEPRALLVHERLAIVDPAGGAQPIVSAGGDVVLAVNGEIYNHRELRASLPGYAFPTGSDCEPISALYAQGDDVGAWLDRLNGIFAFALWDADARALPAGARPHRRLPAVLGPRRGGPRVGGVGNEGDRAHCARTWPRSRPATGTTARPARCARYHERDWRRYDATEGVTVTPSAVARGASSARCIAS